MFNIYNIKKTHEETETNTTLPQEVDTRRFREISVTDDDSGLYRDPSEVSPKFHARRQKFLDEQIFAKRNFF